MLRCLFDPDEKYLGEMTNFIIRSYGNILRKKLGMFPDFPTWKQLDKIMDELEGEKFEREIAEQHRKICTEHSQENPISEQLSFIGEDDEEQIGHSENKQNNNVA